MLVYMVTHNDLSVSEGPVTHFTEIASNLQELGHEIVAFCPDLTGVRRPWGFPLRYVSCVSRRKGISQLLYEMMLRRRLRREISGSVRT
jgi:hypothetical protein